MATNPKGRAFQPPRAIWYDTDLEGDGTAAWQPILARHATMAMPSTANSVVSHHRVGDAGETHVQMQRQLVQVPQSFQAFGRWQREGEAGVRWLAALPDMSADQCAR